MVCIIPLRDIPRKTTGPDHAVAVGSSSGTAATATAAQIAEGTVRAWAEAGR